MNTEFPVCQHRPEPLDFEITYKSGQSGAHYAKTSDTDRIQSGAESFLRKTHPSRVYAEYKLSIIQQADACKHGELGALLRREKLYSNQLAQWRRELAEDGLAGLSKSAPGPVPKKTAEQKRIEQLEKEVERLHHQMKVKDGCLMLQKKALALLDSLEDKKS